MPAKFNGPGYYIRIPSSDPRCRRHIWHDERSRRFTPDLTGLSLTAFSHKRILPILNQGQVGACTADCGLGILGTEPYYSPEVVAAFTAAFGSFDQIGAYKLYNAEENLDGDGPYPPQDNGSSGLTLAHALRAAGCISGWTQTFTLNDALIAGQKYPLAAGTYWFNSMFTPSPEGLITIDKTSGLAGGHEYEISGYDPVRGWIEIPNSWGTGFGVGGYCYMEAEKFGDLLMDQGDITIFVPNSQPAPTPTPAPDAKAQTEADLIAALTHDNWMNRHHLGDNERVAKAGQAFVGARS